MTDRTQDDALIARLRHEEYARAYAAINADFEALIADRDALVAAIKSALAHRYGDWPAILDEALTKHGGRS